MKENYTVYKHIFPNNKIYVGITKKSPEIRWNKGKGYKLCPLMNKAIEKYGWDNVRHEILFTNLSKKEAEQKEIELIKKYQCNNSKYGYNIENGGNCCGTHSEETKKKISEAQKGNKNCIGRFMSQETRKKIGNANREIKLTEKQKEHLSNISKNKKKVNQYDLSGNFIKQYECLKQAEKETGILSQNIGEVCRGQQKYAKGYLWRYVDDNTN